jgi:hypothetical protein
MLIFATEIYAPKIYSSFLALKSGGRVWVDFDVLPLAALVVKEHLSQARWLGLLGAIVTTARAVEVDLFFPRNETYSPAESFPVVFAVQNFNQSVELLNLRISYDIRKGDDRNNDITRTHDLRWANWSSSADPYLAYRYFQELNTTGHWSLTWRLRWQSCDEEALANRDKKVLPTDHDGGVFEHYYSWVQYFTIDDSALKKVDLVAATANATCPENRNAIAINVTDTTMHSAPGLNAAGRDSCVVTVNSTATRTTPDPCRVAIDEDTVASMAAVHQKLLCDSLINPNRPEDCPAEGNGAQQLAALGVSCFLAAFGVVGFALL